MIGKRKIDVQTKLAQMGFIDKTIEPLFNLLFHADLGLENVDDHDTQHVTMKYFSTSL